MYPDRPVQGRSEDLDLPAALLVGQLEPQGSHTVVQSDGPIRSLGELLDREGAHVDADVARVHPAPSQTTAALEPT